MIATKESCSCAKCQAYCQNRVGWFMPDEPEKAAKYLGISLKELFNTKLAIDWWCGENGDDNIFLIAPAIKGKETGTEFDADPRGECIFYNEKGLCDIHPAKPYECRNSSHKKENNGINTHKKIAMVWTKHQNKIIDLLGREPVAKSSTIFDMFGMF